MSAEFVELVIMGQWRRRRENGQRWSRQHDALPSSNVRSYLVECRSPGESRTPLKVRGMLKCEQTSSTLRKVCAAHITYGIHNPLSSRHIQP